MGAELSTHFGAHADLDIWASPADRTLQTVAIVAEHLGRDFFDVRTVPRLLENEVGRWEGQRYAKIVAERGPIVCPSARVQCADAGGGYYPAIRRAATGMARRARSGKDRAIISHGITVRVPRGLLADGHAFEGVTLVDDAPQGTVFRVEDGVATALHVGAG